MDNDQHNRRHLPNRANRGVRNEQNQEQKKQDDQFYNSLFGEINDDQDDESFSQQIGLRPQYTQSANFANYNYGRGYHYFFNLDTFPRVKGSPSYAIDNNRFKNTYRQDQQLINQIPIKQIINRHYIGLPTVETTIGNTKNLDKNVCHYYLFQTQNEKYHIFRQITKCQLILKHIHKFTQNNQLIKFTSFKGDFLMREIYDPQVTIQSKQQILKNRIQTLKQRVKNLQKHWQFQDQMFFHFSQQQLFHNKCLSKGKRLQERNLKQRIFNRILSIKHMIGGTEQDSVTLGQQRPKKFIKFCMKYQEQNSKVISQEMQNHLSSCKKMIEMLSKKQELIIFPSFIFRFGDSSRAVDALMKSRLENDYQSAFYIYKAFVKKLFKRDLNCSQQHLQQPIQSHDYQNEMKQRILVIKDFYSNNEQNVQKKSKPKQLILDKFINLSSIERTPLNEQVHLLPSDNKIQITLKQLMLLYCYRNISVALESFLGYINMDPEILKFMADLNYEKFHYGIARFIDSHEFCILINDMKRFTNILMNTNLLTVQFDQILYFNFSSKLNFGYVWTQVESQDWETEKQESQENQEQEQQENKKFKRNVFNEEFDPKPVKKVKKDDDCE